MIPQEFTLNSSSVFGDIPDGLYICTVMCFGFYSSFHEKNMTRAEVSEKASQHAEFERNVKN
jgi:hypothetical protein